MRSKRCTRGGRGLLLCLIAGAIALAAPACGGTSDATRPNKSKNKIDKKKEAEKALAEGKQLEEEGKPNLAAEKYERVLKIYPEHYEATDRLISVLLGMKKYDDAINVAEAYTERVPDDTKGAHLLADALTAARMFDLAIENYTIIIELDEADSAAIHKRGKAYVHADKLELAIADFKRAIELDGESSAYRISLGSALQRAGRLDEAAIELRGAIQIDPENARAHRLLGNVLRDGGLIQEALAHHTKAARFGDDDAQNFFELGITQNMYGDNLASEASLAKAVELEPTDPLLWYVYGEILRNMSRWKDAVPAYRKALELDPGHEKSIKKLGVVLYEAGEYSDAEVALTAAIRHDEADPYPYFNLAQTYAAMEKYQAAVNAMDKFLELVPPEDGGRAEAKKLLRAYKKKGNIR